MLRDAGVRPTRGLAAPPLFDSRCRRVYAQRPTKSGARGGGTPGPHGTEGMNFSTLGKLPDSGRSPSSPGVHAFGVQRPKERHMATVSSSPHAEIVIPADYLEDVRSALFSEIENDGDMIRTDHEDVLKDTYSGREDRAAAVRILREDMHLLDQVLDASGDTTLRGERDAVVHVLEATVRVLSSRLTDTCQYGPLPDLDVLHLSHRLQWAAQEIGRFSHGEGVA